MNKIELKEGFLAEDWSGEVQEVKYFKKELTKYGSTQEHTFVVNKDGNVIGVLPKHSDDKIFESHSDAVKYSKDKIKKNIEYCQRQIKEYQERVDELKKKL